MTTTEALTRGPSLLDRLADAGDELVRAVTVAAAAVVPLVERLAQTDPEACRTALGTLGPLAAAVSEVDKLTGYVDGIPAPTVPPDPVWPPRLGATG